MSRNKRIFSTLGIIILLALALTLNFFLQIDYFHEIGFVIGLAVISIALLDISKVASETLFFRIRHKPTRIILASFSLILILISAYTSFSVRQWHSVQTYQKAETKHSENTLYNSRVKEKKDRLNTQLRGLESQIKTKQSLITSLKDDQEGKWLRHRYNKEIDQLSRQKAPLIVGLNKLDQQTTHQDNELSFHEALTRTFGFSGLGIESVTNIVIALTVEGIIIFLCFSLSHLYRSSSAMGGTVAPVLKQYDQASHKGDQPIDLRSIREDFRGNRGDKSHKMRAG
ncbi:MAG: hypothetical protein IEMM0008_1196 [bacterium]|nr:MAG: hypothetical protein IEMM0008_1196 [bacterium]